MVASSTPHTGDMARNPGMCLTGNPDSDTWVRRPALSPLSHAVGAVITCVTGHSFSSSGRVSHIMFLPSLAATFLSLPSSEQQFDQVLKFKKPFSP